MSKSLNQFIIGNSLVFRGQKDLPFKEVFEFVEKHPEIQNLNFSDCGIIINFNTSNIFLDSIYFVHPIHSINLSQNKLGIGGLNAVIKRLSSIDRDNVEYLKSLNFSNCDIEDIGEVGIRLLMVVARKYFINLTELNLSHNSLSTKAIDEITMQWPNGSLTACKIFDLSYNKISNTSFIKLVDAIKVNPYNLESLIYCSNPISELEEIELAKTLDSLHINHTPLSGEDSVLIDT